MLKCPILPQPLGNTGHHVFLFCAKTICQITIIFCLRIVRIKSHNWLKFERNPTNSFALALSVIGKVSSITPPYGLIYDICADADVDVDVSEY